MGFPDPWQVRTLPHVLGKKMSLILKTWQAVDYLTRALGFPKSHAHIIYTYHVYITYT